MLKLKNKDTGTMPMTMFWFLYCSLGNISQFVSIVNIEHVIAGWVRTT